MSDAVILLIGAIGVVIAALVLRRTRHERGASSTVVGGVVLTLAGIAAGLLLLPVEDAPSESLGAVGFVPPPPVQPGRGFAVGFGVTVNGCTNPVDVSVVAAGTRGLLDRSPSAPKGSGLVAVFPDPAGFGSAGSACRSV